jgi:hypothetical protein
VSASEDAIEIKNYKPAPPATRRAAKPSTWSANVARNPFEKNRILLLLPSDTGIEKNRKTKQCSPLLRSHWTTPPVDRSGFTTNVTRLDDLRLSAAARAILPGQLITVVSIQSYGSDTLELTYKAPSMRRDVNDALKHMKELFRKNKAEAM